MSNKALADSRNVMTKHIRFTFIIIFLVSQSLVAQALYHRVVRGETLYGIARQYGVPVADLMRVNSISDASRLQVGANLLIPGQQATPSAAQPTAAQPTAAQPTAAQPTAATSHTVQKGDTLFSIARNHGVSLDELRTVNALRSDTIVPGQTLKIPVRPGQVASNTGTGTAQPGVNTGSAATGNTGTTANSGASSSGTVNNPAVSGTPLSVIPQAHDYFWPVQGPLTVLQGKLNGMAIQASAGASVRAVRSGTVVSVGPFRGFGNVAFVQAADGLMYVYGGLGLISVKAGDSIRKTHQIGLLSSEGDSSAYFFVFRGADTIDPTKAPRD